METQLATALGTRPNADLKSVWMESRVAIARRFVQQLMHPDLTLGDLFSLLNFPEVAAVARELRLRDVLPQLSRAAALSTRGLPARQATLALASSASPSKAGPRRRRGPSQMMAVKKELWELLRGASSSMYTTELHQSLAEQGHTIDRITLKRLLVQLQGEAKVECLGGRPRAWRVNNG